MNIRTLVPEGLREKWSATIKQLIHPEILEPYRTERITKDGRTVEVWLIATALVDNAGKVYAISTTEREIPAQKSMGDADSALGFS